MRQKRILEGQTMASSKKGELALLFLLVFPSLPALELDVYHCAAVAAV